MIPTPVMDEEMTRAMYGLCTDNVPFVIATIVRTSGPTAAKPGARALLRQDGSILHGFLGGGCIRGAVRDAALRALSEGRPHLVSVAPEAVLKSEGHIAGENSDGISYARNGCPSEGFIEIFVEPCMPQPELVIFGASPVAKALADLAGGFDWTVRVVTADAPLASASNNRRAIVIATQGQGDMQALEQALGAQSEHVSFVGSHRKFASLAKRLEAQGIARAKIDSVRAPAGLNIGAVTAREIALSILAELVQVRRAPGNPMDGVAPAK